MVMNLYNFDYEGYFIDFVLYYFEGMYLWLNFYSVVGVVVVFKEDLGLLWFFDGILVGDLVIWYANIYVVMVMDSAMLDKNVFFYI